MGKEGDIAAKGNSDCGGGFTAVYVRSNSSKCVLQISEVYSTVISIKLFFLNLYKLAIIMKKIPNLK